MSERHPIPHMPNPPKPPRSRKARDEKFRRELAEEYGDDLLFMDDYDDCVIGVADSFGSESRVAYDLGKVIAALISREQMNKEEAWDWWAYNMVGAYVGDRTPLFVRIIK